jgi:transposase
MAMELGDKRWKLVFSDGGAKRRHETVEAGRRMQLVEAVSKAKAKFHLSPEGRVVSLYEAGRDGFWLHRYLAGLGIENQVVDSSSIRDQPPGAAGQDRPARRGQAADDADALLGR